MTQVLNGIKTWLLPKVKLSSALVLSGALLTGCGYFGTGEQQQLEQAWLAQDAQLQQLVGQIRAQGLATVARGAEMGSLSACVSDKLASDPFAELFQVEGALAESAKISELIGQLQAMMEQEISIAQLTSVFQNGADVAAYAARLLDEQGAVQALASLQQMAQVSQQGVSEDLGQHFQSLLLSCKTSANSET